MLTSNKRKVLTMARIALEDSRVDFLCHAIEHVANQNENLANECRVLKAYVVDALDEHYTLACWQITNGFGERDDKQTRKDRLAWIDWMLGEPK